MKKTLIVTLVTTVALATTLTTAATNTATVALGSSAHFITLAGAGITFTGSSNSTTITGDIGTYPTATITGLDNVILNGVNHAGDAVTQTGKVDLVTAYNDAVSRPADVNYPAVADLGGLTLTPGVHRDASSFAIAGVLTLDAQGDPDAVWIFQAGSTLITASDSVVRLTNGAQAGNVFWQVGSSATLGTYSIFRGSILALTDITMTTGAMIEGRTLAVNGTVTFDQQICSLPPTLARIVSLRAYIEGPNVMVEWCTDLELNTLGFYLQSQTPGGVYEVINTRLLRASPFPVSVGNTYVLADPGATFGGTYTYRLIEVEMDGTRRTLGPYTVTVDGLELTLADWSRLLFTAEQRANGDADSGADPDGDGHSNYQEYLAGSIPVDPSSILKLMSIRTTPTGVEVTWQSETGRIYALEISTNAIATFNAIAEQIPATPPLNAFTDVTDHPDGANYRIRLELP